MTINIPRPVSEIPRSTMDPFESIPHYVAFVIGGNIEYILNTDEETKDILLSNPLIIQVDNPNNGGPDIGWSYNPSNESFSAPEGYDLISLDGFSYPPYLIAIVKDNIVEKVLYFVDERAASTLLSNPVIKAINSPHSGGPKLYWKYVAETDSFVPPEEFTVPET